MCEKVYCEENFAQNVAYFIRRRDSNASKSLGDHSLATISVFIRCAYKTVWHSMKVVSNHIPMTHLPRITDVIIERNKLPW